MNFLKKILLLVFFSVSYSLGSFDIPMFEAECDLRNFIMPVLLSEQCDSLNKHWVADALKAYKEQHPIDYVDTFSSLKSDLEVLIKKLDSKRCRASFNELYNARLFNTLRNGWLLSSLALAPCSFVGFLGKIELLNLKKENVETVINGSLGVGTVGFMCVVGCLISYFSGDYYNNLWKSYRHHATFFNDLIDTIDELSNSQGVFGEAKEA